MTRMVEGCWGKEYEERLKVNYLSIPIDSYKCIIPRHKYIQRQVTKISEEHWWIQISK